MKLRTVTELNLNREILAAALHFVKQIVSLSILKTSRTTICLGVYKIHSKLIYKIYPTIQSKSLYPQKSDQQTYTN